MRADHSGRNWANLFTPVEKYDVSECYNDRTNPMMLRHLAEKIHRERFHGGLHLVFIFVPAWLISVNAFELWREDGALSIQGLRES